LTAANASQMLVVSIACMGLEKSRRVISIELVRSSDVHGLASSHGPGQSHGLTMALAQTKVLESQSHGFCMNFFWQGCALDNNSPKLFFGNHGL
jgi:carbamoylphosphate synthase small subunit